MTIFALGSSFHWIGKREDQTYYSCRSLRFFAIWVAAYFLRPSRWVLYPLPVVADSTRSGTFPPAGLTDEGISMHGDLANKSGQAVNRGHRGGTRGNLPGSADSMPKVQGAIAPSLECPQLDRARLRRITVSHAFTARPQFQLLSHPGTAARALSVRSFYAVEFIRTKLASKAAGNSHHTVALELGHPFSPMQHHLPAPSDH